MQSVKHIFDVLVIGGGPAGLSAAGALARQLVDTVILDSNVYRNRYTSHMHNVAGWDHASPSAFREKARADLLARYPSVRIEDGVSISHVAKDAESGIFQARDDATGRSWLGRKIVLATGVRDVFPAHIAGYEAAWGRSVFHCLFCHGFEEHGAPSAGLLASDVLADPKAAAHVGKLAARLARFIRVYADGNDEVADVVEDLFRGKTHFSVERRRILAFELVEEEEEGKERATEVETHDREPRRSSLRVKLADGTVLTEGFVAHAPRTELNDPFVQQLGLELSDAGDLKVSQPFNETSVPGVFAAGDVATPMKSVVVAMSMGAIAGVGVSSSL